MGVENLNWCLADALAGVSAKAPPDVERIMAAIAANT
jgi:hypothetical protein